MKVLVTGAAGFLGSWLADALVDAGHDVTGVDDFSGGDEDNLSDGWPCHPVSVLDLDAISQLAEGNDAIAHCAALPYEGLSVFSPSCVVANIVVGSVNVAVAAARCGVKRVLNCSSMARYGACQTPYEETMRPRPVDPYGLAKRAAEQQLNLLGEVHGFKVVHAVPHNIYGPRQRYTDPYRNVTAIFANLMLQGRSPTLYGDGLQTRCFSYISDVLPTLVELLTCDVEHGEVFNVGPDEGEVTVAWLAREIAVLTDFHGPLLHAPDRPCEVKHALCSSDKIRQRFNFQAKTPLREGLGKLVAHIKERGPKPFDYRLPVEIVSSKTPKTWTERVF